MQQLQVVSAQHWHWGEKILISSVSSFVCAFGNITWSHGSAMTWTGCLWTPKNGEWWNINKVHVSYSGFQNKTDQNLTKKKSNLWSCSEYCKLQRIFKDKKWEIRKRGINRERDCVSVSLSKHVVRTKRSGHIVCAVVFQFHWPK